MIDEQLQRRHQGVAGKVLAQDAACHEVRLVSGPLAGLEVTVTVSGERRLRLDVGPQAGCFKEAGRLEPDGITQQPGSLQ